MKVFLGPMNELEVDAQYHDPSDIDAKLKGTRVIPMWLVCDEPFDSSRSVSIIRTCTSTSEELPARRRCTR